MTTLLPGEFGGGTVAMFLPLKTMAHAIAAIPITAIAAMA